MADLILNAVIGVVAATLGYASKDAIEWWKTRRTARASARVRLQELLAMVDESRSLYYTQSYLATQLFNLVRSNHSERTAGVIGYDDVFRAAFEEFTPAEADLHAYIRSLTVHSVNRVHKNLRSWLDDHYVTVKSMKQSTLLQSILSDIEQMRMHLNAWDAQYCGLFEPEPGRAVNFVSSSAARGPKFPSQLSAKLTHFLAQDN